MTTLIPQFDLKNGGSTPTGAINRPINQKLSEVISVKDFGAKGDNTTDDTAAIQATLDYAGSAGGGYARYAVYFPDGYYIITSSLQVPSWITMYGDTPNGCIINNQTVTLSAPQCVNAGGQNIVGLHVRNMTFRGGTYAFNFSNGMQSCVFENVNMDLQTSTNLSTTDFEINKFINCIFANADYGISSSGTGFANFNDFINCEFNTHTWSCIYFYPNGGSSVNNFVGCRFENGGTVGRTTIDLAITTNTNFDGCYFENTSTLLLNETGSTNSTKFDGCHFTYGASTTPYTFNSDGIIQFGTNNWAIESTGSNKMMISGMNNTALGNNDLYFAYSPQHKKMVSKWITTPSSLQQNLITFTRLGSTATPSNLQVLTGVLTINFYTIESGGFGKLFSRLYQVNVIGDGIATMTGSLNNFSNLDNASGATLVVDVKSGATASNLIIEAVLTGLTPSTEIVSALQWSFEYIEASTLISNTIYPSLSV